MIKKSLRNTLLINLGAFFLVLILELLSNWIIKDNSLSINPNFTFIGRCETYFIPIVGPPVNNMSIYYFSQPRAFRGILKYVCSPTRHTACTITFHLQHKMIIFNMCLWAESMCIRTPSLISFCTILDMFIGSMWWTVLKLKKLPSLMSHAVGS